MADPLSYFNDNFWKKCKDEKLEYALRKNAQYKDEVEKWLSFFRKKGWLNEAKKEDLRSGKTFPSFYSKINEFRAGWFVENKKDIILTDYETPTRNDKNVEFKGRGRLGEDTFIEIKTPLVLDKRKSRWFDNRDTIIRLLDKANKQLPNYGRRIVILSDDLEVSLLDEPGLQYIMEDITEGVYDFENIDEVWILGNIDLKNLYTLEKFKMIK